MQVDHVVEPSASAIDAAIQRIAGRPGTQGLLVLLAVEGLPDPEALDPVLAASGLPVIGGAFPRVIVGDDVHTRGGVVIGLPAPIRSTVVHGMSRGGDHVADQLDAAFGDTSPDGGTVITFYDATATNVDGLLAALFDRFGLFGSYLGGGAGALSFERMPCVFTEKGMVEDAAVIGLVDVGCSVGVAHGWESISEPMHVTVSDGRSLGELDDRPAAQVYQGLVEAHAAHAFDPDDFFALARSYPLGIVQLDGEMVVRDPLFLEDQGLNCAGEVPAGAFVQLLHGNEHSLLAAAASAAASAAATASDPVSPAGGELVLVFDCISRVLYLGDRFAEELATIDVALPRVGAATIGEVCNPGDRYLEVFNKTIVVARLGASGETGDD